MAAIWGVPPPVVVSVMLISTVADTLSVEVTDPEKPMT
jgi:hypothetical protein